MSGVVHALDLASFVTSHGGHIPANRVANFYLQHPEAKAEVSKGARAFCEKHPHLLRFELDAGAGVIHATAAASQHNKIRVTQKADTTSEHQMAVLLSNFIQTHGGSMHVGSGLGQFYRLHPEARLLIRKPQKFCSKYPNLLLYEADPPGPGMIVAVSLAQPKTKTDKQGSATNADASTASAERIIASQLCTFLAANGGSLNASAALSRFYDAHPHAKGRVGKLDAFCSRHPDILRLESDGGGRLISVISIVQRCDRDKQACPQPVALSRAALNKKLAVLWQEYVQAGWENEELKAEFDKVISEQGTLGVDVNSLHTLAVRRRKLLKKGSVPSSDSVSSAGAAKDLQNTNLHATLGADARPAFDRKLGSAVQEKGSSGENAAGAIVDDPWQDGDDPWSAGHQAIQAHLTGDDSAAKCFETRASGSCCVLDGSQLASTSEEMTLVMAEEGGANSSDAGNPWTHKDPWSDMLRHRSPKLADCLDTSSRLPDPVDKQLVDHCALGPDSIAMGGAAASLELESGSRDHDLQNTTHSCSTSLSLCQAERDPTATQGGGVIAV
eukprot:TRINITY_DN87479_c0_g1_i1.p1 TRINITY_DN87479_c0_g1~~TRINITY_DN87479_c0_g1_i1.p1  ORF type:complete len:557 (+),score=85.09 TRINITY_DN87479_c0_g1_i1:221-1891(+)